LAATQPVLSDDQHHHHQQQQQQQQQQHSQPPLQNPQQLGVQPVGPQHWCYGVQLPWIAVAGPIGVPFFLGSDNPRETYAGVPTLMMQLPSAETAGSCIGYFNVVPSLMPSQILMPALSLQAAYMCTT
jgi:hypothetical protein